jgi:multiple sugar transport system permease protein
LGEGRQKGFHPKLIIRFQECLINQRVFMKLSLQTQKKVIPYLFLIPAITFFLVFQLFPIIKGIQMSFYNWSIMPGKVSEFIGWDNYTKAFNDPIVKLAAKNTLIYALVTVPGQMIFAMMAAVLLNTIPKGKGLFRALYYLAVLASWVIVSLLIRYMFQSPQGVVNYILVDLLHIVDSPIPWLIDRRYAFFPICILGIWKGIGWSMVIYLAALQVFLRSLKRLLKLMELMVGNVFGILLFFDQPNNCFYFGHVINWGI